MILRDRAHLFSIVSVMKPGDELYVEYPSLETLWPNPPITHDDDGLDARGRAGQWADRMDATIVGSPHGFVVIRNGDMATLIGGPGNRQQHVIRSSRTAIWIDDPFDMERSIRSLDQPLQRHAYRQHQGIPKAYIWEGEDRDFNEEEVLLWLGGHEEEAKAAWKARTPCRCPTRAKSNRRHKSIAYPVGCSACGCYFRSHSAMQIHRRLYRGI